MSGLRYAAIVAVAVLCGGARAAPYVPRDDAVVLERLPEKGDPALAQLKRMRAEIDKAHPSTVPSLYQYIKAYEKEINRLNQVRPNPVLVTLEVAVHSVKAAFPG